MCEFGDEERGSSPVNLRRPGGRGRGIYMYMQAILLIWSRFGCGGGIHMFIYNGHVWWS